MLPLVAVTLLASPLARAACPEGTTQVATTCGLVPLGGCCDVYQYALFCHEGLLCTQDCGAQLLTCGWNEDRYSCGNTTGEDPSGTVSRDCPCTPACDGKVCGPDGCGGTCGQCAPNEACTGEGRCECVPNCTDRDCGSDGCGGSCGSCKSTFQWSCSAEGRCVCEPYCTGRECGPDGCSGSCGSCTSPLVCAAAKCQSKPCAPSCLAKQCGSDGCEGTCGECDPGDSCTLWGQCESCMVQCEGRECGSDGCGGTCGQCLPGQTCSDLGQCTGACVPQCQGKACGPDKCGGTCGACGPGQECDETLGTCTGETCFPNCVMKECGSDGCGGSCGDCPAPRTCGADQLCHDPCMPLCEGRACGDDGCGGLCGECPEGATCHDGECRAPPDGDLPGTTDSGILDLIPPDPCPPGTTYYYGQCVSTGQIRKGGGCSGDAASPDRTPPLVGILLGVLTLAAVAFARRRHRKGEPS